MRSYNTIIALIFELLLQLQLSAARIQLTYNREMGFANGTDQVVLFRIDTNWYHSLTAPQYKEARNVSAIYKIAHWTVS